MNEIDMVKIFVGVFVAIPLVIVGWVVLRVKQSVAHFEARMKGMPTVMMTKQSNFLGFKLVGRKEMRGNGGLALTNSRLMIFRFLPEKLWEIPMMHVLGVEVADQFLGRGMPKQWVGKVGVLVVRFVNERRDEDACGVIVRDPEDWKEKILKLAEKRKGEY